MDLSECMEWGSQMRGRGADDNEALGEEGHCGIELVLGQGTHLGAWTRHSSQHGEPFS